MLLLNSLLSGVIFSVFMGMLITIIQFINPRYELKSYPEKIKNKVPPLNDREKRNFRIFISITLPVILALLLLDFFMRINYDNILLIFLHFVIVQLSWVIFDLIIMDWLIFCTITPKYLILKGSENDREYKNYSFHLRGIVIGIPISLFISLFLSLLVFLIKTII